MGFGNRRDWRRHEDRARHDPVLKGYRVQTQKHSKITGGRPDIFAIDKHDTHKRIVIEAKHVRVLRKSHVDQLRSYSYPFFPSQKILFVKADTVVPRDVAKYAKANKIKIHRRKRRKSFWEWF